MKKFFCGMVAVGLFFQALPAQAFTVSPVMVEKSLQPGSETRGSITLINTSAEKRQYVSSVQRFRAQGEDGAQVFYQANEADGALTQISVQPAQIILEPHQRVMVEYVIRVPQEVQAGGWYGVVFFSERRLNGNSEQSIAASAQIGVLFLLSVSGETAVPASAQITRFAVEQSPVFFHLPIAFDLRIQNMGSIHIRPQGSLSIRDMFGKTTLEIPINPTRGAVLPHSARRFQFSWTKGDINQKSGFVSEVQREWNHFAVGRYTADVRAAYGAADQTLVAHTVFWVIPWGLLCLGGIGVLFLVGGAFVYRSFKKKR